MAPVEKRARMAEAGSTSSSGTGPPDAGLQPHQAAQGGEAVDWSSTACVYSLKIS